MYNKFQKDYSDIDIIAIALKQTNKLNMSEKITYLDYLDALALHQAEQEQVLNAHD